MYNWMYQFFAETPINLDSLPNRTNAGNNGEIKTILGIAYGIVGALALLYIVISGFRYIISDGDPQKAAQAKQGILYALIGLIVALTAQVITIFVIGKIT